MLNKFSVTPVIPGRFFPVALFFLFFCVWIPSAGADDREYAGVIYPLQDISLSMGAGGVASSVDAKLGDYVVRGDLLVRLDDAAEEIEAQRRQVIWDNRAEIDSLSQRLTRMSELVDDLRSLFEETGAVSRDELYRAELELFSLQGRHDQLLADKERERLEFFAAQKERDLRRLNAPVSGYITQLIIDVGEWVKPGEAIAQLVDVSSGLMRLAIPESLAQRIKIDSVSRLRFDGYPDIHDARGQVSFISAVADPASGLVQVEVRFDNSLLKVRPGIKAYVRFTELLKTP